MLAHAGQSAEELLQQLLHSPTLLPCLYCLYFAIKLVPVSSSLFMLTQQRETSGPVVASWCHRALFRYPQPASRAEMPCELTATYGAEAGLIE